MEYGQLNVYTKVLFTNPKSSQKISSLGPLARLRALGFRLIGRLPTYSAAYNQVLGGRKWRSQREANCRRRRSFLVHRGAHGAAPTEADERALTMRWVSVVSLRRRPVEGERKPLQNLRLMHPRIACERRVLNPGCSLLRYWKSGNRFGFWDRCDCRSLKSFGDFFCSVEEELLHRHCELGWMLLWPSRYPPCLCCSCSDFLRNHGFFHCLRSGSYCNLLLQDSLLQARLPRACRRLSL